MKPVHVLGLCLSAPAALASAEQRDFQSCTDYHCDAVQTMTFTSGQWQSVRDLFVTVGSAAEEHETIRRAVALPENSPVYDFRTID